MKKRGSFKEISEVKSTEEQVELDALVIAARFLSVIQKEMDNRDWRLKDFAHKINVSASYITQVFQGDKLPNFKFMAKAQQALNLKFCVSTTKAYSESIEILNSPILPYNMNIFIDTANLLYANKYMMHSMKQFIESAATPQEAKCVSMYPDRNHDTTASWHDVKADSIKAS